MIGLRSRTRRILGAVLVAMLMAVMTPIAPASAILPPGTVQYIFVDPAIGSDTTGNGSYSTPYKTITYAMTKTFPGDYVKALSGTYSAASGETMPIAVEPGVTLYGYEGADVTIIDGAGATGCVTFSDATTHTAISGFTITAGTATSGGGVRISRTAPTLPDSDKWWPRVENCIITGNTAVTGGGIAILGDSPTAISTPKIYDCRIQTNEATANPSAIGGGIYANDYTDVYVWISTVEDNYAEYGGGGATLLGDATIKQSSFSSNYAGAEGGAIVAYGAVDMWDCWFDYNRTDNSGGALVLNGTSSIEGTYFGGNSAMSTGGAITVNSGDVSMSNCIVADNATDGFPGGVIRADDYAPTPTLLLNGCTIVNNPCATGWDGILMEAGTLTVKNSIIRHDLATAGVESSAEDVSLGTATATYLYSNTRDTDLTGTGVIHGDPMFTDAASGNYELKTGSPCIDSGDPIKSLSSDFWGRVRPADGNDDTVPRGDMGALEHPAVVRLAGDDRYKTAAAMSNSRNWYGDTAVIASGANFPDALAGSSLAGAYGGPLLITTPTSVPAVIVQALQNAGVSNVVIVGGKAVVYDSVVTQLQGAGFTVARIGGVNRYATAAMVANQIDYLTGYTSVAFLVRGDQFADALAASPIGYAHGMPILLTGTYSLPTETRGAITALGVDHVVVVGGTGAVSDAVKNAVDAMPGVTTERIQGKDRYETAANVATWACKNGYADWAQVGIATGVNFPDALSGGALCGIENGVLLLTSPTALPPATYNVLSTNKGDVYATEIYGGTLVVVPVVKVAIEQALGW